MADQDILCTHDLTPVSDTALRYALCLADRTGGSTHLLHVTAPDHNDEQYRETAQLLDAASRKAGGTGKVVPKVVEGRFMEQIAVESGNGYGLVVLGTHGPRGLRQNLFGSDILKLVRSFHIPSIVVQEQTVVKEENLARIVLPVAAHSDIDRLLNAVCWLALLHASEVHVYQLMRPNELPSQSLLDNKLRILQRLQLEGIRHVEANEPSSTFSVGFAGPTIEYAQRVNADCIAIMSHASDEFRYIADAEKERMMTNAGFIPVLCA